MDVEDLAFNAGDLLPMLDDILVEIDFPETGPIFHTNEDSVRTRMGMKLDLDDWENNAMSPGADCFVYTPNPNMPPVMADPYSPGEDIIAVVSDDFFNMSAHTVVQSGLAQEITDEMDIVEILKTNAPELTNLLLLASPDIKISTKLNNSPISDFSSLSDAGELNSLGNFYIPNMVIKIENLQVHQDLVYQCLL